MIEIVPQVVDTAFLYFHTRRSTGDELAPFVDEFRRELPTTYLWAGDGPIEGSHDDPVMRDAASYGTSPERYWFVFPLQGHPAGRREQARRPHAARGCTADQGILRAARRNLAPRTQRRNDAIIRPRRKIDSVLWDSAF